MQKKRCFTILQTNHPTNQSIFSSLIYLNHTNHKNQSSDSQQWKIFAIFCNRFAKNLYFAIYHDENGKRSFDTIALNIVIERLKQGLSPIPEIDENGNSLLMFLNPYDLVYVSDHKSAEDIDISGIQHAEDLTCQK